VPALASLKALSLANTPDDRRNLVLAITRAFDAVEQEPNDEENALFCDVVGGILDQLTEGVRAELSDQLATAERTPSDLAYKLASDPSIAVARPILENSSKLTDDQLVEIAASRDDDHRLAIAKRATVSEAVTDVLVERSGREVLRAISANRGAAFSESGVGRLLERGGEDETVQKNLIARSRDDAGMAGKIRAALTEGLQAKLGAFVDQLPAEEVEHAVEVAQQAFMAEKGIARRARMERNLLLEEINAARASIDSVLAQLARERRLADIGWIAAKVLQIPVQVGHGALTAPTADAAVIVCRAVGVSEEVFALIARLRARELDGPDAAAEVAEFGQLSLMEANRAIRLLKMR